MKLVIFIALFGAFNLFAAVHKATPAKCLRHYGLIADGVEILAQKRTYIYGKTSRNEIDHVNHIIRTLTRADEAIDPVALGKIVRSAIRNAREHGTQTNISEVSYSLTQNEGSFFLHVYNRRRFKFHWVYNGLTINRYSRDVKLGTDLCRISRQIKLLVPRERRSPSVQLREIELGKDSYILFTFEIPKS